MNQYVKPVCLPTFDSSYNGERVTVAGWGSLSAGGSQPASLREVDVNVWTNSDCASNYRGVIPGKIKEHMICAATCSTLNGQKVCRDSCSVSSIKIIV